MYLAVTKYMKYIYFIYSRTWLKEVLLSIDIVERNRDWVGVSVQIVERNRETETGTGECFGANCEGNRETGTGGCFSA